VNKFQALKADGFYRKVEVKVQRRQTQETVKENWQQSISALPKLSAGVELEFRYIWHQV
jgi:hypothetical protein